ncbi:MAG: DNA polymerase III subunit gamma/tau [Desulfovibrio sp.]|nr:DNA polymerase III subunit gamma/tau [Desulfovibrio sp.]
MEIQKKLALAARYRPQSFAEVAGQDMVKAVLSRAALEDSPACAYLFSGTRGVGKTTIARIFAKALNCEHSPAAEPCNTCTQCQKITNGTHVDVVEIDGASNNGVEDIRALRETVGYAPMEGRYKVFIIDEAHMLSNSAFNALLKTLEEPPARVVFIMATTEVHKFPITIVSRCQHFTFRHLREEELTSHLAFILEKEGVSYEEGALDLLAKRAEGSVRDSMSLLDQTLAFGEGVSLAVTRDVLGLAGHEFFSELFSAIRDRNASSVVSLTRELLRRGVDIGFFLRELAGFLRSLFLLGQGGPSMAKALLLSPQDQSLLSPFVADFSPAHLHAAWQLVLEGHKSVVLSTEPASALELLLLNLALLPALLPLENLEGVLTSNGRQQPVGQGARISGNSAFSDRNTQGRPHAESLASAPPVSPSPAVHTPPSHFSVTKSEKPGGEARGAVASYGTRDSNESSVSDRQPLTANKGTSSSTRVDEQAAGPVTPSRQRPPSFSRGSSPSASRPSGSEAEGENEGMDGGPSSADRTSADRAAAVAKAFERNDGTEDGEHAAQPTSLSPASPLLPAEDDYCYEDDPILSSSDASFPSLDWPAFCAFCANGAKEGALHVPETVLRNLSVEMLGFKVLMKPASHKLYSLLRESEGFFLERLRTFLHTPSITLEISEPEVAKSSRELVEKLRDREELAPCLAIFDAVIEQCREH